MTTIQILKDARLYLRDGHWAQGVYDTDDQRDDGATCYCAAGAIYAATTLTDDNHTVAMIALATTINPNALHESETFTEVEGIILRWNDYPERTEQDVLDAFTATINRLESEGAA